MTMKYERIKEVKEEKFKRLTGRYKKMFEKILKILKEAEKLKRAQRGRIGKKIEHIFIQDKAVEYQS